MKRKGFLAFVNKQYEFMQKFVVLIFIWDILAAIYVSVIIVFWGTDLRLLSENRITPIGFVILLILFIPSIYFKGIQTVYAQTICVNDKIKQLEKLNQSLEQRVTSLDGVIVFYKLFNMKVIESFNKTHLKMYNEYLKVLDDEGYSPGYMKLIDCFPPRYAFEELCKNICDFIIDMTEPNHVYDVKVGILRENANEYWEWVARSDDSLTIEQPSKKGMEFYKTLYNHTGYFIESKQTALSNGNYILDVSDKKQVERDKRLVGTIVYLKIKNDFLENIIPEYMLLISTYGDEIKDDFTNNDFSRKILDLISIKISIFANIEYARKFKSNGQLSEDDDKRYKIYN